MPFWICMTGELSADCLFFILRLCYDERSLSGYMLPDSRKGVASGGDTMAKVIMTCGKICCGKTTYAKKLKNELNAVILSIDDITLTMFPEGAGEMHDTYALRAEQYLLSLSLQVLQAGTDVILDWGLWTRAQRERIRAFYRDHGNIPNEIHYLRIREQEWQRRIRKRNEGQGRDPSAYYVDEGLLEKVESLFEEPAADETDLIVEENNP